MSVDGANGIGAGKMREIMAHIKGLIDVKVFNDGSSGRLNFEVPTST